MTGEQALTLGVDVLSAVGGEVEITAIVEKQRPKVSTMGAVMIKHALCTSVIELRPCGWARGALRADLRSQGPALRAARGCHDL